MPRFELEMFGPLIASMSQDSTLIKECLPKITDMKSEMITTADTVRNMKCDLIGLKCRFMKGVSGLDEAARDNNVNDLTVFNDVTVLQVEQNPQDSPVTHQHNDNASAPPHS